MPICPNKSSQEWKDLVSKLSEEHGEKAESIAKFLFFKKGDIPTIEEARNILSSGRAVSISKDVRTQLKTFFSAIKEGKTEGELAGAMAQGKSMAKEMRLLAEGKDKKIIALLDKLDKKEISIDELKNRIKELGYESMWKEAEARLAVEISGKAAGRKEGRLEERKTQKEFANRVSKYLEELKGTGKISDSQAATIARRAGRVGTSELAFAKFSEYVDKVVTIADYENKINEIKSLQEAARKIKSPLSSEIKLFTNINPENIPESMLTKYKQALDEVTGKVPNPSLMKEMTFDIQSIKDSSVKEKTFENIKTIDQAQKAFQDIYGAEIKSIEDYKDIIRKTNYLKRKLNDLLDKGDIEQEQYDDVSNYVALEQKAFEQKYASEIEQIKNEFINDIKSEKIEPKYKITKQESELIEDINNITEDELKRLSVEDLYILNEASSVANDSYIDVAKFYDVKTSVDALYADKVAEQLNGIKKTSRKESEIAKKLMFRDDVFWEGILGLPPTRIGDLYLQIITPFRKGVSDYVDNKKRIQKSIYDIVEKHLSPKDVLGKIKVMTPLLKKKYIEEKTKSVNKIGMIAHYLQEYMSQFNSELKNIKDIGTRDEFALKLYDEKYTDKIDSENTLKMMRDVYESLPKDENGKVNPRDVYDDFVNKGGKYLNDAERSLAEDMWELFDKEVTDKQEYANNLRNRDLKRIPFYMSRSYYTSSDLPTGESTFSISAKGDGLKIASQFGKERVAKDIMNTDLPKTDFVYLMNKSANETARDYNITKTLQDLNKRFETVYKDLEPGNRKYMKAVASRIKEALEKELKGSASDAGADMIDKILSAKSIIVLADPIRTFIAELPSGVVSYPIRSGVGIKAYSEIFKNAELANKLKDFTRSPIRIKENINSNFDLDTRQIVLNPKLNEAAKWLSGFTEAHLNNMIWMPKFRDAFKDLTGLEFDAVKFNTDESYRRKYKREIDNAGSISDNETQAIIGPTTTASGRLYVENIFTKLISDKPLKTTSGWGKIVSYLGGYTYRESIDFSRALNAFARRLKDGEGLSSLTELSRPLGIAAGLITYGYLSKINYYVRSYAASQISGDNSQEEYARQQIKQMLDYQGVAQELIANAYQIMGGRYGAEARMAIQAIGTAGYYWSNDKETKDFIDKTVQNITFQRIPKIETKKGKAVSYLSERQQLGLAVVNNIVIASNVVDYLTDALNVAAEDIPDLLTKLSNNELTGDDKEKAEALRIVLTFAELTMLTKGLAIPLQKTIQKSLDDVINPRAKKSPFARKSISEEKISRTAIK